MKPLLVTPAALLGFVGESALALAACLAHPARLRWRPILYNIRSVGFDALPIVGLGLAYGGCSYTKETTGMKLGPIELKVQEKENVNVLLAVSAGAIALGAVLLVLGRK